jgi:hypothetical protein
MSNSAVRGRSSRDSAAASAASNTGSCRESQASVETEHGCSVVPLCGPVPYTATHRESRQEVPMLQLRPSCECCDVDLPPQAPNARICSFECTFCETCAESKLGGTCPNCGGELVRRPIRPSAKLTKFPAAGLLGGDLLAPCAGAAPPNPSLERTSTGKAPWPRGAQVHHAPRGPSALPVASAQLKR